MPLAATIVWEVRNGGSDTNGGGFKTGASGTDHTLQDAAQYSVTDGVTAGTTTITSATANFGTDVVGNVMYVEGGTGSVTAGWYEITARTNSTTVTVDRSTGLTAGTGVTLKIGGALASPGRASGCKVAGNDVYIKYHASAYTLGTTSTNVATGPVNDTTGGVSSTNVSHWVGYDTNRTLLNSDANRPAIDAGSQTGITMFRMNGSYIVAHNFIVDGNSGSTVTGVHQENSYQQLRRVLARDCTVRGIHVAGGNGVMTFACAVTGCSGTAAFDVATSASVVLSYCEAYGNSIHGFLGSVNAMFHKCIASGNTGGSTDGFGSSSVGWNAIECVAYGNGRNGFNCSNSVGIHTLVNCIAEGNAGYGFASGGVKDLVRLINCAGYSNTPSNYNTGEITNVFGFVAGSGSFFTNAASGDFSLNNTSGGGAAARAAGFGAFPRGTTVGYLDIGAAQHADSGGGGAHQVIGTGSPVVRGAA